MLKDLLFKLTAVLLMVSMTNLANGQGMSCDMAEVITDGTYTLADTIPTNGSSVGNGDGSASGSVWYAYTPAEGGLLDINSCLGGADTRFWVHTGDCMTPMLYSGNDDACAFAADGSGPAYASAVEDLPVTGGTTYIIEWDNRWSNAAFTFNVAFTPLPAVDVAGAGGLPYTRYPDTQAATGVPIAGVIGNLGASDLTGAVLTASVFSTSDLMTPVWTMASMPMDLAIGAVESVDFGMWTPAAGQDDYIVTYVASANETEEEAEMANNADSAPLSVKKTYAFDDQLTGTLGNPDSEIWQGQNFTFAATDTVTSVTLFYGGDETATLSEIVIYTTDPTTGAPVDSIYAQTAPNAPGGWVTVELDDEFAVEAGDVYYFGLHTISVANVALGTDNTTWRPGNAWLYLAVIEEAWRTPESVSANFQLSYALRVNVKGDAMYNLTASVDMNNETVGASGVFLAGSFNGWDASANPMSDDDGDGVYTATVSVPQNSTPEWKFVNNGDMWEDVPADCALAPDTEFLNRFTEVLTFDTEVEPVCFSLCTSCPIMQEPCSNPDAVLCDNFDQYELGAIGPQSDIWVPWPGGETGPVTDAFSQTPNNSLQIVGGGTIDQVMLLPANVTSGNYTVRWSFYVPAERGAYFNLQGDQDDIGGIFKMQMDIQPDGEAHLDAGGEDVAVFDFPQGEWVDVVHYLDFDNDWAQLVVNGELVHQWLVSDDTFAAGGNAQVGGVNFFGLSADYEFYIDDVEVVSVPSCADASIICDPFESYMVGDLSPQSSWWGVWPTADDAPVAVGISNGGEKSLQLTGGAVEDPILLLGDRTEGNYRFYHEIYVEEGNLAYYNIQNAEDVSAPQWNIDLFIDGDGTGRVSLDQTDVGTFTYTSGEWTGFEHLIDLDNSTHVINVNGTEVYNAGYAGDQLGAVNYFPIDETYIYNIDNVNFSELEPIVVEPDPVSITLTVNTEFQEVAADGMFIAGSFSGWENVAMTDNGDDTWSVTVMAPANSDVEYKFKNGADGWEEGIPGTCTVDGNDGANRSVSTLEDDVTVDVVCFDACVDCPLTNVIDYAFDASIAIAPNPTNGIFAVSYDLETAADLSIRVSNILGQVVAQREIDAASVGTEAFDMTKAAAGTYNLVVTDGTRISTKRIVIQ